jgi:hypothetical protein
MTHPAVLLMVARQCDQTTTKRLAELANLNDYINDHSETRRQSVH